MKLKGKAWVCKPQKERREWEEGSAPSLSPLAGNRRGNGGQNFFAIASDFIHSHKHLLIVGVYVYTGRGKQKAEL